VVVGPRLRGWLEADDDYLLTHGGTYAGHPTCCAAGIANLEILRSEDLPERARHAGSRLRVGLDRLADRSGVAEVRGEGLMQAVALRPPLTPGAMVAALLTRGIIARGLPYANSIAFSPPLVISDGEIDEIVDGVDAALADVAAVV
jgi:L-2,4-diaminobutyrate transaminase